MDEKNIQIEKEEHFRSIYNLLSKRFEKRRINTYLCDDTGDLFPILDKLILSTDIKKVTFSDSVTLHQLGIYEYIYAKGDRFEVINPFERQENGKLSIFGEQPPGKLDLPYDEYYAYIDKYVEIMRQTLLSDVLLIGANAITMEGEIVSIDGSGNRVSGMIFGPKKVIIIVGRNKIVKNVESALDKIHNYTAPVNYIRHDLKHHNRYDDLPCVKNGICINCSHPRSACMNIVIVRGAVEYNKDRIHLIIVNKDLGI